MHALYRLMVLALPAGILVILACTTSSPLQAEQSYNKHVRPHQSERHRYRERGRQPQHRHRHQRRPHVIHHGPPHRVRPDRVRRHHNVIIVRPHGHWYPGYGWFRADHDAFKWLAFTAITLKVLDNLNEAQQREHEAAQIRATRAEVGETIYWNREGASGSVTVVRDGTSTTGRYCREFQQEVSIGGKSESAYGTACRNADGSWEVISTRSN